MQLPTAIIVKVAPLTEQVVGVLEENATVSIDGEALAVRATGVGLKLCAPGLPKLIVWLAFCTVSVNACIGMPLALVAVIVTG